LLWLWLSEEEGRSLQFCVPPRGAREILRVRPERRLET
jgi:hypothetical protein